MLISTVRKRWRSRDLLPRTEAVFGRSSKPQSHWLYMTDLASPPTRRRSFSRTVVNNSMLLEFRIGGGRKARRACFQARSEQRRGDRMGHDGVPAEVNGPNCSAACHESPSLRCSHGMAGDRQRYDAALTVGGFLARAGFDEDAVASMVQAIATAAGDDEVADRVQAARDAVKQFGSGGGTCGFPKLAEIFGEPVARKAAEWIGYASNGQNSETVEPIDLWASFPPPELPAGLLPDVIERFARAEARTMGCDVAGLAMGALTVVRRRFPTASNCRSKSTPSTGENPRGCGRHSSAIPARRKTRSCGASQWRWRASTDGCTELTSPR